MAEAPTLLMLVGAATPPGRLAAAIAAAAEAARAGGDVAVDILNLAEVPIETCDGRALEAYGAATRQAVAQIAAAGSVLIGAPVYRASFPGVLKNLLDITPVEALQNKPTGIVAMGGSPHHNRQDLAALCGTLTTLARRLDPATLGPLPLAAKFT
jgi:NAD(P)H-dependent FMN reductase